MRVISLLPIFAASVFAIPRDFSVILLTGLEAAYPPPPEYPPECPATFPCYGKKKDCCPPGWYCTKYETNPVCCKDKEKCPKVV